MEVMSGRGQHTKEMGGPAQGPVTRATGGAGGGLAPLPSWPPPPDPPDSTHCPVVLLPSSGHEVSIPTGLWGADAGP